MRDGRIQRIVDMGEPDDLMQEIPTFLAKPLSKTVVNYSGYELLNRPYALLQWAYNVVIEEDYVVIEESDHVYLRPVPNLMLGPKMVGAYYWYMQPTEVSAWMQQVVQKVQFLCAHVHLFCMQ